jgi:hypothetical protein
MMHSLRLDSGAAAFTQSHHNIITTKSLNVFLQMANNFDILDQSPAAQKSEVTKMKKVGNSYIIGTWKLKSEISIDSNLSRFKLHMLCDTGLCEYDPDEPVHEGHEL